MRLPESLRPVRMSRIAVLAPDDAWRAVLLDVAAAGTVEFDEPDPPPPADAAARLTAREPDPDELRRNGRPDLLAGEAQLRCYAEDAERRDGIAALTGWCPADRVAALAAAVAAHDGAVVPLPAPRGVTPPTSLRDGRPLRRAFAPLVRGYGTVPYADVDPTLLAGAAYVAMFGMMFADAGHGLILLACASVLGLRRSRRPGDGGARTARWRHLWPFLAAAGAASMAFGLLLGEFFGPTGVVPVRWLDPIEEPVPLLAAGVGLGAVLLAGAYAVGVVNRWREGALRVALYAPSGVAGAALFAGLALLAAGVYTGAVAVLTAGVLVALVALGLAAVGLYAATERGATGAVETGIHLVDLVVRLGSNLASFTRLAAFGLAHAALGALVWNGTTALARTGGWAVGAAAVVFLAGNVLTFGLEVLVAGIQALRLSYYELFSRVFVTEGRPFRPWHLPVETEEVVP